MSNDEEYLGRKKYSSEEVQLGCIKYFSLLATLSKPDADCLLKTKQIYLQPDLSEEDAQFLLNNSAKLKRVLQTLILTHVSTFPIPTYDKNILKAFLNLFSKVSDMQGMLTVVDRLTVASMEARIDNV